MTAQADIQRTRRQHFATPGGSHDRLVKVLGVLLPSLVGALMAFMVLSPLSPRGEISFLLDKNTVEIAPDRVRVDEAMYRGEDSKGQPFSIKAGSAVQKTAREPVVDMQDLEARILLSGTPALLEARRGSYNMKSEQVAVAGPVQFSTADGYRMQTRDVDIDLKGRRMQSRAPVEGRVPSGTFRADRIRVDMGARTVTLDGNARLRMEPGALR